MENRSTKRFCRDLVEKIGGIHNLGSRTPYSAKEFRVIFRASKADPTMVGWQWIRSATDVVLNVRNVAGMGRMDKSKEGDPVAYRRYSPLGPGSASARFWDPKKEMPCQQPPWAELMAVNGDSGDIVWRVPLGVTDELEAVGIHTGSVRARRPHGHRRRLGIYRRNQRRSLSARLKQVQEKCCGRPN